MSRFFLTLTALCLGSGLSVAEIHRWQDASGQWHFSDLPKEQILGAPRKQLAKQKAPTTVNYQALLIERYGSQKGVSEMSLAVVSITTQMGSGSGFFITSDGYLLTNKHVVRPNQFPTYNRQVEDFKNRSIELENWHRELTNDQAQLADYARQLKEYKATLQSEDRSDAASIAWKEYRQYEQRYESSRAQLLKREEHLSEALKSLAEAQQEFNLRSGIAATTRHFSILLKDRTELKAHLISLSPDNDLALLKVDGVQVPFIDWRQDVLIEQGQRVYAIGSPLGIRDAMTAGIIARVTEDYVVTDAQILPGNSGGPLLSESGKLIGINTLRFHNVSQFSDGFGAALPAHLIRDQFGALLD